MTTSTPPPAAPVTPMATTGSTPHVPAATTAAAVITRQMMGERRRSAIGYSIGMALLMLMMVAVYPSIRETGEELDAYMDSMPASMRDAFGLAGDSISSPQGYLMSQLYSNMFPIVLLVLGIALAAWTVAGSEAEGTLEMLLANPVTRVTAATARAVGVWLLVAVVTIVATAVLAVTSPAVGLDDGLPWWGVWSAGLASYALVMFHASIAFAVGAATGRRAWAIGAATVVLVLGFAAQLVGSAATSLTWLRDLSPWYWLIDAAPLTNAPGWLDTGLPVLLAVVLTAVGVVLFNRRDLAA